MLTNLNAPLHPCFSYLYVIYFLTSQLTNQLTTVMVYSSQAKMSGKYTNIVWVFYNSCLPFFNFTCRPILMLLFKCVYLVNEPNFGIDLLLVVSLFADLMLFIGALNLLYHVSQLNLLCHVLQLCEGKV
jgi:hypothetical protein